MSDRYPWRDTSEDISAGKPPQWETPGGAQEKVDTGIEDFAQLPEIGVVDNSITARKIRPSAVVTEKIAPKAITLDKMAPAPLDAANHTYTGVVAAATVKEAIDKSSDRVEYFIEHSGDSVVELVDARIPENGAPYPKLGDRLNATDTQLAETVDIMQGRSNYIGGMFTIVDDDSPNTFFTRWKPILDATDIKISQAVNTSFVGTSGHMTLAQLKQLKAEGHDILSHGYTHPDLNTTSLADIETEWQLSKQYLIDNDLGDGLGLVYPTGLFSISDPAKAIAVKALTRKYYRYGIDAVAGATAINTLPVDSFEVLRMFVDPATVTLASIKTYIDDAFANNKWYILLTHCGLSWNDTTSPTNLTAIINYVKGLGMPILNYREAEELVGNSISQGDTRTKNFSFVGKNGATRNSVIANRTALSRTMTVSSMDAPISEYEPYSRTTTSITNLQDTFLSGGGVMEVTRGNVAYSFALFYPALNTSVYRRYWQDGSSTWSAWKQVGDITPAYAMKSGGMNAAISEYETHKLSAVQIPSGSDSFLSTGGVLSVYRGDTAYSYAIYHPALSNKMYKRYWIDGSSTWSAWTEISDTVIQATNMDAAITTYTAKSGRTYRSPQLKIHSYLLVA